MRIAVIISLGALALGIFMVYGKNNAQDSLEPGTTRVDEHGVTQVWVPAGSFLRGTSEEEVIIQPPAWANRELPSEMPQHPVTITQGYWIDQYEVTNAAFGAFVADGGYENESLWSAEGWDWLINRSGRTGPVENCGDHGPDYPRVCITWYEAEAYAAWRGGRLPTEAEWEYAARGPESLIFPYGNEFSLDGGNIFGHDSSEPVGSFPDGVSWVNAHDMSGNAMEWVNDWLDYEYYQLMEEFDPQGPETGRIKIEKGGWWGSHGFVGRAAYHHFQDPPTYQDHHIGVRIVTEDKGD